ncbi:unnamed protein product, partial [Gulo gulo]
MGFNELAPSKGPLQPTSLQWISITHPLQWVSIICLPPVGHHKSPPVGLHDPPPFNGFP